MGSEKTCGLREGEKARMGLVGLENSKTCMENSAEEGRGGPKERANKKGEGRVPTVDGRWVQLERAIVHCWMLRCIRIILAGALYVVCCILYIVHRRAQCAMCGQWSVSVSVSVVGVGYTAAGDSGQVPQASCTRCDMTPGARRIRSCISL